MILIWWQFMLSLLRKIISFESQAHWPSIALHILDHDGSSMCNASNSYVALYRSFTIVILPTFLLQPVTLFVASAGWATNSCRSWADPAAALIDGGAERPVDCVSGHSQELLGAICVLQHLQTVNAINNVNICQTHMYFNSWINDNF